jgi:uncharacterized UPF0160 family protein
MNSFYMNVLQEHLFELEAEQALTDDVKPVYVLYPEETAGKWRIQAVPVSPDSFESRKALPEAWRGLRDENLSEVSGIDGCIFVHASGFIGGKTLCIPHYDIASSICRGQDQARCIDDGQKSFGIIL